VPTWSIGVHARGKRRPLRRHQGKEVVDMLNDDQLFEDYGIEV